MIVIVELHDVMIIIVEQYYVYNCYCIIALYWSKTVNIELGMKSRLNGLMRNLECTYNNRTYS